jgi:hypothetical protein
MLVQNVEELRWVAVSKRNGLCLVPDVARESYHCRERAHGLSHVCLEPRRGLPLPLSAFGPMSKCKIIPCEHHVLGLGWVAAGSYTMPRKVIIPRPLASLSYGCPHRHGSVLSGLVAGVITSVPPGPDFQSRPILVNNFPAVETNARQGAVWRRKHACLLVEDKRSEIPGHINERMIRLTLVEANSPYRFRFHRKTWELIALKSKRIPHCARARRIGSGLCRLWAGAFQAPLQGQIRQLQHGSYLGSKLARAARISPVLGISTLAISLTPYRGSSSWYGRVRFHLFLLVHKSKETLRFLWERHPNMSHSYASHFYPLKAAYMLMSSVIRTIISLTYGIR